MALSEHHSDTSERDVEALVASSSSSESTDQEFDCQGLKHLYVWAQRSDTHYDTATKEWEFCDNDVCPNRYSGPQVVHRFTWGITPASWQEQVSTVEEFAERLEFEGSSPELQHFVHLPETGSPSVPGTPQVSPVVSPLVLSAPSSQEEDLVFESQVLPPAVSEEV